MFIARYVFTFNNSILGIPLYSGDENDAFVVERLIPFKVGISLIEYGDIAAIKRYGWGDLGLVDFTGSYHHEGGQVSGVIQFHMQLYRALLGAELGPVIKRKA